MRKLIIPGKLLLVFNIVFICVLSVSAQNHSKEIYFFKQVEQKTGILFNSTLGREELRSDKTFEYEELTTGAAKFQFTNRYWEFLDYKQEQLEFNFELGPLWGKGNWIDSSITENIEADHKIFGVRTNLNLNYSNRYYWDRKNFTIVDVGAWGRYDYFQQNSEGTVIDSNLVRSVYNEKGNSKKLRYGLQAKAGWGFGRLNPMNYFMIADYLLKKYYPGRNFSEEEIIKVADEIGRIKQERDYKKGHNNKNEIKQLESFISSTLFLTIPGNLTDDWQYGEFAPRLNGQRVEVGPFFRYYNIEPDFVYGAYLKYENSKYKNYKWNRNLGVNLIYNRYKRQDWMLAEFDLGWSYFYKIKNQFDFGLKYIPGTIVNGFEDIQPISHNFIPYVSYFTQLNSKTRVKINLALKIADNEQFMLSGPEFSMAVYRSKY